MLNLRFDCFSSCAQPLALIPIRSAKLAVYKKHEKHRGSLPCGQGREAPEEHQRIA